MLAGHIKVLGGPHVVRGPNVALACPRLYPPTPWGPWFPGWEIDQYAIKEFMTNIVFLRINFFCRIDSWFDFISLSQV